MRMNVRRLILLIVLFAIVSPLRADEIVLKSGRSMTGKITAENDTSYTIRLRSNMYLSVAKDEVLSVKRNKPAPVSDRPTYKMETPAVETSTGAASAVTKSTTPLVEIHNMKEASETGQSKVGIAVVTETMVMKNYVVTGDNFESAHKCIVDRSSGRGFLEDRRRHPSKTEWSASWSGTAAPDGKRWKSVEVISTVTVTAPAWTVKTPPSAEDAKKWADFLKQTIDHESGHSKIVHEALISFAESAAQLSGPSKEKLASETESLFKSIREQAALRRQGYERREGKRPLPIKKKS